MLTCGRELCDEKILVWYREDLSEAIFESSEEYIERCGLNICVANSKPARLLENVVTNTNENSGFVVRNIGI